VGAEENRRTIETLYAALDRGDGETMAGLYAPRATFTDPVFVGLSDGEPGDMWRMLTGRAQDMTVELVDHHAEADRGTAHWVARYTFGQTGRHVVNDVRSIFRFDQGGRIVDQQDDFDFWRWARQALGRTGLLMGWTPVLQHRVRDRARAGLEAFRDR
jgi:ketosteroid isomerase-like protein